MPRHPLAGSIADPRENVRSLQQISHDIRQNIWEAKKLLNDP